MNDDNKKIIIWSIIASVLGVVLVCGGIAAYVYFTVILSQKTSVKTETPKTEINSVAKKLITAADPAKDAAVQANMATAESVCNNYLLIERIPAEQVVTKAVPELNNLNGSKVVSPYDDTRPAYGYYPAPGIVIIKALQGNQIELKAYNRNSVVIAEKVI